MVLDGPCSNTMNPTKDATYTFLAMFLQEVGTIFKDEYLFLGGDEVTQAPCPPLCSALLVASDTRTRSSWVVHLSKACLVRADLHTRRR